MTLPLRAALTGALLLVAAGPLRPAAPPAVGRDLHGDPLPAGAVARLGTLRYRLSSSQAVGLAFTPEGLIVAATAQTVEVFDAKTGRRLRSVRVDFNVNSFALSPNGKQAAVAGFRSPRGRDSEGVVRVISVADGKEVRTWLRQKERNESKLAFSADGKLLASLSDEGLLRLEEVRSGDELYRHRFARSHPAALAFSADGAAIAAAVGYSVHAWRWKEGGEPVALPVKPRGATSLSFSPDGKTLATGSDDEEGPRLWDVATGKKVRTLTTGRTRARIACFSPDGKRVVSTSYKDRALILWDAGTGKLLHKIPCRDHLTRLVAFSRDSRRLAALDEGVIRIWDVATGKPLADADGHARAPNVVLLLKNDVAVTSGDDGAVRFWDARTGKQTRRIDVSRDWLRTAAVSPDGRWLATSEMGENNAVCLWDVKTGKRVYRLPGHHSGSSHALAFTPDGKRLASYGGDQYLRLWDVKKGKAIEEHAIRPDGKGGPKDDAGPVERERLDDFFGRRVLSSDGRLFATASQGAVFVFDVVSGKQKAKVKLDEGMVQGVAFSPDNKSLLVTTWGKPRPEKLPSGGTRWSHEDGPVLLIDLASGDVRLRLVMASDAPFFGGVAWRPDGKRFAVSVRAPKPCIRTFDPDGKSCGEIALPAPTSALAYSPDGKRLLVSQADTTALVYDAPEK